MNKYPTLEIASCRRPGKWVAGALSRPPLRNAYDSSGSRGEGTQARIPRDGRSTSVDGPHRTTPVAWRPSQISLSSRSRTPLPTSQLPDWELTTAIVCTNISFNSRILQLTGGASFRVNLFLTFVNFLSSKYVLSLNLYFELCHV